MGVPNPARPNPAELDTLRAPWQHGPCTVRQVHEGPKNASGTGYTTVLKILEMDYNRVVNAFPSTQAKGLQ